ncbi:MAG TPA: hypothetical protein VFA60_03880 [Terriglobales bacterium]|nr:hypothetical protein [Terriglobales bacterium]
MKRLLATTALLLMLSAPAALGQGCSMCITSAAGAGAKGQRAISRGVIFLLLPPVGMMAVLVGVALKYKSRNEAREARRDSAEGASPQ